MNPLPRTSGSTTIGTLAPGRGVFCNRTLNLRSIKAIGYDMDYTLIHYHVDQWEGVAYEHTRERFAARGWPVQDLRFDPHSVTRGLLIDRELGNLVKANRFGYVIKAAHGTRVLSFDELRRTYAGTSVELSVDRFVFLNTLFSYSEACLFAQLVDLLDQDRLEGVLSYGALYDEVRSTLDEAHSLGEMKAEIMDDPARFVVPDPETPLALLDQKHAGKSLLLITNSEWDFTRTMMTWSFDPFLPEDMTWRDLFDIVIVSARKPSFFHDRNRLFEVTDPETGLLAPSSQGMAKGGAYFGGGARLVETTLNLTGDEILYVGDHLFGDVHASKDIRQWRTALVLREMEREAADLYAFEPKQERLTALMREKVTLEGEISQLRLQSQRARRHYGPPGEGPKDRKTLDREISRIRERLVTLDEQIGPLARESSELGNATWGPLMRAGNDKSLFARQVERYADVYTSQVSNFLHVTPFGFLRAPRSNLPHDAD
ncbi:MAG: haloacid dehalogenase [Gemmatimonadota bacterium]|nr:MAG: haloacid dehalogenase [Gemmatimonadota bacterium]